MPSYEHKYDKERADGATHEQAHNAAKESPYDDPLMAELPGLGGTDALRKD